MTDESGILSMDFMVGFTIFLLAFVWVANMVPGLFIGLNAYSIDYDAVAYRSGVILAEDPGAIGPLVTDDPPWEALLDSRDIARFGLAVSKDTPLVLDRNKVNRFFNYTDFSPDDYQSKLIFGDRHYNFNISLRETDNGQFLSVGTIIPQNHEYGYIRRAVKIKEPSNTTIGGSLIQAYKFNKAKYSGASDDNVASQSFSIVINTSRLRTEPVGKVEKMNGDGAYRIYPNWDRILINLTDLEGTRNTTEYPSLPNSVFLSDVKIYQKHTYDNNLYPYTVIPQYEKFVYVNWTDGPQKPPIAIKDGNVSLVFEPGFFRSVDKYGSIIINMSFTLDPKQPYLNNTHTPPFDYNYNPVNVTQPSLHDAVLEVAVW